MRLLITGAWRADKEALAAVTAMGHELLLCPDESGPLPCDPAWVEGVIANGLFLHHPIEAFTSLRFIQLTSAGLDRIDLTYTTARGISLYAADDVYSIPMAEHALGCVLSLYRDGGIFYINQKSHVWEKRRELRELYGQTVLILGCGHVGNACAARFAAMGCTVLGMDVCPREDDRYECICPPPALPALLPRADVVICALPLTERTRGMIDAGMLSMMKRGSVLVNLSRGAVVDTEALRCALTPDANGERLLYGAVLDVLEKEPLPASDALWDLPGVILTPHNAFIGSGNAVRLRDCILRHLKEYGGQTRD